MPSLLDDLWLLGLVLSLLGVSLLLLPKWNHMKWYLEVQKGRLQEADRRNDFVMKNKIAHDVRVFENRRPLYGTFFLVLGMALLGFSIYLGRFPHVGG